MKVKTVMIVIVVGLIATFITFGAISYAQYKPMNRESNNSPMQNPAISKPDNANPNKEQLENIISELVAEKAFTEEQAQKLLSYLESNAPQKQNGIKNDPIKGAIENGIITQEQAELFKQKLKPNNNSGIGQKPTNGQKPVNKNTSSSTLGVKDANNIENNLLSQVGYSAKVNGYPIVDTGVGKFYSNTKEIDSPSITEQYYGQDASYQGNQASYTDNKDGTITDNVTGLMWQKSPGEKLTWQQAVEKLKDFELAGYEDWRLPTIKELYSLVHFNGSTGHTSKSSQPYIHTDYFDFEYGDEAGETRFIDSQMATSTIYDSSTMNNNTTMFGFNFADGRIKGYPIDKEFYVYFVRGNTSYGQNKFIDNKNGTITDLATGLMWMTYDSGYFKAGDNSDGTLDWKSALDWCENLEYAGYDDWKLPDAKELQSIVDYTKSPDTTASAAINDMFYCTPIKNYGEQDDYAYYWSSTTHLDGNNYGSRAVYFAFGRGMGQMNNKYIDVHGAGCQRSDLKTGNRDDYPTINERAPQGDEITVFNMVRAVRKIK